MKLKTAKVFTLPAPRLLAPALGSATPTAITELKSEMVTYRWQFPLGSKMAVLSIGGTTKLNTEDMDALLNICVLFRRSIKRSETPDMEDYCI